MNIRDKVQRGEESEIVFMLSAILCNIAEIERLAEVKFEREGIHILDIAFLEKIGIIKNLILFEMPIIQVIKLTDIN